MTFEKAYLFVAHSAGGIGGGQRYILSKSRWLIEKGWRVGICFVPDQPVILDYSGIDLYPTIELRAAPSVLGRKRVETAIRGILKNYSTGSQLFIESSAPFLGIWGELIACKAGGIHLCYVLEEKPRIEYKPFLNFKRTRHELAFISSRVAAIAMGDAADNAEKYGRYVLKAYNSDPVEDIPVAFDIEKGDLTIGCISRLEKPSVMKAAEGILSFCKNNPSITVVLILIGDSPFGSIKGRLLDLQKQSPNYKIQLLGYLAPIPRTVFSYFDLCIGKAGAATVCAREGVPTLRYSLEADELLGFDGYEVKDGALLPGVPHGRALEDVLEDVVHGDLLDEVRSSVKPPKWIPHGYDDHLSYIGSNPNEYFDVYSARPSVRRMLVSVWIRIFNNLGYTRFL